MSTYAFRSPSGDIERMSPLGKPPAPHTLTAAAEAARVAVRLFAHARGIDRVVAGLVTDHGAPHVEPYDGPRPTAATRLEKLAAERGFRTNVFETAERTVVEGFKDPHAFRASWLRGRAESATWHERTWRYAMVSDARPIGVSARDRVALAGKRAAGVGAQHLSIVASPVGIPVGITEVTKRVKES